MPKLQAEMRRESQETGRLIENLFDEIEPPAVAKEMNYGSASRAQRRRRDQLYREKVPQPSYASRDGKWGTR